MDKIISYCIPVMNRFLDIKNTLSHNISVAKNYSSKVEIIINCFDKDNQTENYVTANFHEEIKTGLLVFNKVPPLPYWHFCWAKNSFRKIIKGKYYASLDGDNYITDEEIKSTLNLCQNNDQDYLIHLFSGKWGDGTSGRIIVPKEMYEKYGYISTMFPRQFDEMALILSVLNFEDVIFVSKPKVNIFELSGYAKDFKKNSLSKLLKHIECDFGMSLSPLMPRGEGYVGKDPKLSIYQNINAYYVMHEISERSDSKGKYLECLKKQQEKVFSGFDISTIEHVIFSTATQKPHKTNELTVYSVIKDDANFLNSWYRHYKNLGVERFIIIDDNSEQSIKEILNFEDVYVFKPKVGNFKLFKTFWIKILCSLYQLPESWILTVDCDELLDPSGLDESSLPAITKSLDDKGLSYCGGILIDMFPAENVTLTADNFINLMDHHLWRKPNKEYGYQDIPSIKWAFSKNWELSFEFDFRYRFYGTIDSLRKFPLVKFKHTINFNQGFHALAFDNIQINAEDFFQKNNCILPIKHYKFFKILSEKEKSKLTNSSVDGYFERTKYNILKIVESEKRFTTDLFYNSIHKTKYCPLKTTKRFNNRIPNI